MRSRSNLVERSVLICVLACAGCRAASAPNAGFLDEPKLMQHDASKPFDDFWLRPGVELRDFNEVYVAPVDTTHLLKMDWWDKTSLSGDDQAAEAQVLAKHFQEAVRQAFAGDKRGVQVVDNAGNETLIVELALVQVVPTKVWLNVVGYVAIGALDHGATAFEGRLRDGGTGQVIAEFKDREFGLVSVVNVSDLTWYGHSKHTIGRWADEIRAVCAAKDGQSVSPMSTVTLRPW